MAGEDLYIHALAEDENGVEELYLFVNGEPIARERLSPYEWGAEGQNHTALSHMEAGTHVLRVESLDTLGNRSFEEISVVVHPKFSGESLPGRIEAEDYASLKGFQVLDSDEGPVLGHGYIGGVVEFPVHVPEAGEYEVSFRLSSAKQGARFDLSLHGDSTLISVYEPATGSFLNYVDAIRTVFLPKGEQVLSLVAKGTQWNINHLTFTKAD